MSERVFIPNRGDIIHINFSPSAGSEMADPHYALVLSPLLFNRSGRLAVVVPITSKYKHHGGAGPSLWYLQLPQGLSVQGWAVCSQIRTIDYRERGAVFKTAVPTTLVEEALDLVLTLLEPQATEQGD